MGKPGAHDTPGKWYVSISCSVTGCPECGWTFRTAIVAGHIVYVFSCLPTQGVWHTCSIKGCGHDAESGWKLHANVQIATCFIDGAFPGPKLHSLNSRPSSFSAEIPQANRKGAAFSLAA